MASEFSETFLRDADESLSSLRMGVGKDVAARALHSLKSGSAFLGWDDLENAAHGLEDALAESYEAVNWTEAADILENLIAPRRAAGSPKVSGRAHIGRAVLFNDFEKRVLDEARSRQEAFYRLICSIDSSEPLPYPRAYLLASRLETDMTLVKSDPPMNSEDADFSRPIFWFATDLPESEIFAAANVDLVSVEELKRLEFSDVLDGDEDVQPLSGADDSDATLIVDRTRYNEAMQIVEELSWRLDRFPGKPESNLSNELLRTLEALAYKALDPMLSEIGRAVGRLAERRGLQARFEWSVASGGLDATTYEALTEMLKQLVRNSLRHGIETPRERTSAGKDSTGVLRLSIERLGTSYRFEFDDDGRGIDEDAVFERAAKENLIVGEEDADLLNILCTPGFSTSEAADLDGGRGLGLEMIRHMAMSEFGSGVELDNRPGKGFSLRWTMPEKHVRRPYLLFLSDGRTWAIPADAVRQRGVMDRSKINASGQGYRISGGLVPMVGPLGLLAPGTMKSYFLEIHHRGRRAALLVDDLVSEEPWGSDELIAA
ncbi:MAG: ATP-binding protein, partial [Spirochaetaceae bacterium]|nr:ATP-binding protein [Spirochaetaceae bacterium]